MRRAQVRISRSFLQWFLMLALATGAAALRAQQQAPQDQGTPQPAIPASTTATGEPSDAQQGTTVTPAIPANSKESEPNPNGTPSVGQAIPPAGQSKPTSELPENDPTATAKIDKTAPDASKPEQAAQAPGTAPVGGDQAPPEKKPKKDKDAAADEDLDKVVEVGSELTQIRKGSIDDVDAVGNRDIGGRGLGNWYSVDSEIKMGRGYAAEIDKSTRFITDPVVTEYVNRVGQNIVKNSDCKVPFTIKVIDSDEVNAFALPGGFFYVNSGLILNADEEAELAGVMAHETAHVCAHHAVRELTRMQYAQLGTIPLIFMGGWTGYGLYEASSVAVPVAFMQFSRDFEAQADYLGVQYMYRAGYDPQAFIAFFEKIQALEKRKPGSISRVFADHPQTPDRILHSQEEIAHILPPRDQYTVTTSEFNDVKARLARIENKRRLNDAKSKKPTLRKTNSTDNGTDGNDRPTLHPRND